MIDPALHDIFVDDKGKLWRCIGVCHEPTVTFEEVEGRTMPANQHSLQGGLANQQSIFGALANLHNYSNQGFVPPIIKDRKSGGARAAMWDGWKRIHRPAVDLK